MPEDIVIIYAGDGGCYWAENGCGYVRREYAGVYTREEAIKWTSHCGPEKRIELHPVPEDHIPTLKAQLAALRADAERYRWIRNHIWVSTQDVQMNGRVTKYARIGFTFNVGNEQAQLTEPELFDVCVDSNAAIDAAMRGGK